MKNMWVRAPNFIMLACMVLAALAAWVLRPTELIANSRPKVELEQIVPRAFGAWQELPQTSVQIINPQQTELLQKLYTQTLSRSYVNEDGSVVMLSIAYGANQSDSVQLHYPEVCYPAQGFQVLWNRRGLLTTKYGDIPVRRLMTKLGARSEPVTYWSTLGDKAVIGGINTKLAKLQYGFEGKIPDGLIFRLSSITQDANKGLALHERFARDLATALPASVRARLTGIAG